MRVFFLSILFLLAILLEVTIIQLPFVMLLLLLITVMYRTEWVFILSIFLGILVDSLLFRHLGVTSLFYLCFSLGIFWYEQKFELRTIPFVGLMSSIGALAYFLLFGSQMLFLQIIMTCAVGILLFLGFSFFEKPPAPKYHVG